MSEQWHQHLQNLTWWEEIDRFFNPSKYSCSTFYGAGYDVLFQVFLILIIVISIGTLIVMLIYRKYTITITEKELSVTTQKSESVK